MTLLAVTQMTSTTDVEQNLATVAQLLTKAHQRGAEVVVVPEAFAFLGERDNQVLEVAEPLEGALFSRYRDLAREAKTWVCYGGFCEQGPDDKHTYNTHVVVTPDGDIAARYRKIHLFDVDIPGGPRLLESNGTAPGNELVVADSPAGKLGLSICYDLRFPELYLALCALGAGVLLVPAAFTLTTGKEHWEALLRARAIENQVYVAAAAQRGKHNAKRQSFGHAMIIDSWGTVVAQCSDASGVAVAEVDAAFTADVRQRMPVSAHRRPDIYGQCRGKGEQ